MRVHLQDSSKTSSGQDGKAHSSLTSTTGSAGARLGSARRVGSTRRLGSARRLGGGRARGSSTSGSSVSSTSSIEQAVAADGHEAGVGGQNRAVRGQRGQLVLVAAEPGQHLCLVGGVVGAEAGGDADLAGVGLRVLGQVRDDGGRRRGQGRDDAQGLGGAFAQVGVGGGGGGSCAGEEGVDVEGGRGRSREGEDGDGGTHDGGFEWKIDIK